MISSQSMCHLYQRKHSVISRLVIIEDRRGMGDGGKRAVLC